MVSSLGGLAAIISWQQTERQSSSVTGKDCSKGWLAVTALCCALEKLQTDSTRGYRALMESVDVESLTSKMPAFSQTAIIPSPSVSESTVGDRAS